MPTISCFYNHYNREPFNFTFIQFEKFVKVILNFRSVVLTNAQLVSNPLLFQIFKLSLLLTEDTSVITSNINEYTHKTVYGVSTMRYWKHIHLTDYYEFVELEKSSSRNPLKSSEPKRASSYKKIKKFMRLLHNIYETDKIVKPNIIINEYLDNADIAEIIDYFTKYIEYNRKIEMLSVILHNYGRDVYRSVMQHL